MIMESPQADGRCDRLALALRKMDEAMGMQEKREAGEFHISQPSAKAIWDEAREMGRSVLAERDEEPAPGKAHDDWNAGWNAAIASLRQPVSSITDEMVERACKKYAFREDGAMWPDDYSPHEVAAERVLMREFLTHVLAPQQTSSSESAPKWSPTPPTKDGWYWERFGNDDAALVGYRPEWPVHPYKLLGGYLWYGPIEAPPL